MMISSKGPNNLVAGSSGSKGGKREVNIGP
jgi:hypothetical protein